MIISTDRLNRIEKLAERFVVAVEKIADTQAKQAEQWDAAAQQVLSTLGNPAKLMGGLFPTPDGRTEEEEPTQ